MIDENKVARIIAWLMRNEGVSPDAIERAVDSANTMRLGEFVTLGGDDTAPLRRAFVYEQMRTLS